MDLGVQDDVKEACGSFGVRQLGDDALVNVVARAGFILWVHDEQDVRVGETWES